MKLNGWVRLWIFISTISAVIALLLGIGAYPDGSYIAWQYKSNMEQLTEENVVGARHLNIDNPYLNPVDQSKPVYQVLAEGRARAMDEKIKALSELSQERFETVVTTFSLWLGFVVSIYVFGWFTAWTIRGFKESSKTQQ